VLRHSYSFIFYQQKISWEQQKILVTTDRGHKKMGWSFSAEERISFSPAKSREQQSKPNKGHTSDAGHVDVVGTLHARRRRRESPTSQSRHQNQRNHKKQNMTTTSPTRRRCVFVVSLLLLTSFPRYSCGQETATIADEAAAATAATAATAGDAIAYDATESVIDLDDAAGGTAAAGDDGTACVVADDDDVGGGGETTPDGDAAAAATTTAEVADDDDGSGTAPESQGAGSSPVVVQSGPFVDLLGDLLLSLEMIDETKAQVHQHPTNVALDGKKVVGLYFSADW